MGSRTPPDNFTTQKQLAGRLLYSSVSKGGIRMGGAGVGKNVRELAERVVLVSEEV